MEDHCLYWGEIHTHTGLSDGCGTLEENFEIAESQLDFWAMADHAFDEKVFDLDYREKGKGRQILNDCWGQVQDLCRTRERPGSFVPFLAYEWTNFQYGHHNVYYLDYDQPLRMPPTLPELYESLAGVEALVIPHHTGYAVGVCGKNWDFHDEGKTPFVEVYSYHGTSEEPGDLRPLLTSGSWMGPGGSGGSVQEGLARGYRLGIMASSDSHGHHPGAYDNGLIAAYAGELTRQSLWDAFKGKRIYGVTGDRIELDFAVNGAPMGSSVRCGGARQLEIAVTGWDEVERVDVVKNNQLLHCFVAPTAGSAPSGGTRRLRFMVEWGWDRLKQAEWKGRLSVPGGRIIQAVPCFRSRAPDRASRGITRLSEDECEWSSLPGQLRVGAYSRAFADAIAFEVECRDGGSVELGLSYDRFEQALSLSEQDLLSGSRVLYMEDIPPTDNGAYWDGMETYGKLKVHRASLTADLTLELEHEDAPGPGGGGCTDFYYVRVIQKNGQRAWSSPVWVDVP